MLFCINEKIFHREKVMRKSLTIAVVTILCVVLSLSFVSCNPNGLSKGTSDSGSSGSSGEATTGGILPFSNDSVSAALRSEILKTNVKKELTNSLDGLYDGLCGSRAFASDEEYDKMTAFYTVLKKGKVTYFAFVQDKEYSADGYKSDNNGRFNYTNGRLKAIDGSYEVDNETGKIRLYKNGDATPLIDASYSVSDCSGYKGRKEIYIYNSDSYGCGEKICDGTDFRLATADNIAGTWIVDNSADSKRRTFAVFAKNGSRQDYEIFSSDIKMEVALNSSYSISNGLYSSSNEQLKNAPAFVIDGKYFIYDYDDYYGDLYLKVSSETISLVDNTTNPFEKKNPTYTTPVKTNIDEGTYVVDLFTRGGTADISYEFSYVDLLPNNQALFVGTASTSTSREDTNVFINGTYSKNANGNYLFKIGSVELGYNKGVDRDEGPCFGNKLSDNHIFRINNFDKIKGCWYAKEFEGMKDADMEVKFIGDTICVTWFIPKSTSATSYGYTKVSSSQMTYKDSFMTQKGAKDATPLFMCGDYLCLPPNPYFPLFMR